VDAELKATGLDGAKTWIDSHLGQNGELTGSEVSHLMQFAMATSRDAAFERQY
jgi:hypothetical protein